MHIFNLNNKPYLVISSKELLFRQNNLDEQMQRIPFTQIKKITLIHRYNPQKELFVWLSIQTTSKSAPYLIQVSLLEEGLEEVFSILKDELKSKVKLILPKNTKLSKLRTYNKGYKRLSFLVVLLFLSLLIYHKFVFPPLDSVQIGSTKLMYQKPQGICSINLKVAYTSQDKENALVKNYCGLLGFWKEQGSKQVPLKYLKTEFESYSAKDWTTASRKFIKEKKYNEAIISLEKSIYLDPENKYSHVVLSKVYNLKGDHNKALSLAKETVEKYKNFALAHENIANLYKDEKNSSAASLHLEVAIRLDPKARYYTTLAQIQSTNNLNEKSLSNYEKALVLRPDSPYILTMLGLAYWEKKAFTKAETSLQKAYLLKPENPAYFLNYYEISLVTTSVITPEQKEDFLYDHQADKKYMMLYDMLQIIEATIEGKEVSEAKEKWKEKYHSLELDWSFSQMRAWLDDSSLEIEHIQDIQRTLGFFIGHQQAYTMGIQ